MYRFTFQVIESLYIKMLTKGRIYCLSIKLVLFFFSFSFSSSFLSSFFFFLLLPPPSFSFSSFSLFLPKPFDIPLSLPSSGAARCNIIKGSGGPCKTQLSRVETGSQILLLSKASVTSKILVAPKVFIFGNLDWIFLEAHNLPFLHAKFHRTGSSGLAST